MDGIKLFSAADAARIERLEADGRAKRVVPGDNGVRFGALPEDDQRYYVVKYDSAGGSAYVDHVCDVWAFNYNFGVPHDSGCRVVAAPGDHIYLQLSSGTPRLVTSAADPYGLCPAVKLGWVFSDGSGATADFYTYNPRLMLGDNRNDHMFIPRVDGISFRRPVVDLGLEATTEILPWSAAGRYLYLVAAYNTPSYTCTVSLADYLSSPPAASVLVGRVTGWASAPEIVRFRPEYLI